MRASSASRSSRSCSSLRAVASIGRAVRSKSRVQPIPVLDMEVVLDDPSAPLKPGQAVRVEVQVPDAGRGNK